MKISDVINFLKDASALAGIALKIRDWFISVAIGRHIDPALKTALDKLSKDASADDIVNVLRPFYLAKGGDVQVKARHDGGGDVSLADVRVEGGSGPGGGGSAIITAGDGGPHGKGGNIEIKGGVIKGGDAK
ncbi:MAG: hypothetical protein ABSA77_06690 [Thermoguttaceae bacterium]|jgi:hypothetical protein